jgi:SAM-dependent methyltransferase
MTVSAAQLSGVAGSPEPAAEAVPRFAATPEAFLAELEEFAAFGARTRRETLSLPSGRSIPVFLNEFWTARQRQAHRLHEISYRACFKPQLPRFFLERLTRPGDVVYDPFGGRGTTAIEAALHGRVPWSVDINPLSIVLTRPRLTPVTGADIARRLEEIDFAAAGERPEELLVFYHPETLREICALRRHLLKRRATGAFDPVDGWIQMVAANRLTGHSAGFFSVYTLPPNQATSVAAQKRINARRRQVPPRREVPALILRKARRLLAALTGDERARLAKAGARARLLAASADDTPQLPPATARLVVTSPPFLNAVNYKFDNWLRGWFCGIDLDAVPLWQSPDLLQWEQAMERVFRELRRLLTPGGWVAFEVGEVRKGEVLLEKHVCAAAERAGLEPVGVLINAQEFTKTSNCWGITNQRRGTNTNRVSLLRRTN